MSDDINVGERVRANTLGVYYDLRSKKMIHHPGMSVIGVVAAKTKGGNYDVDLLNGHRLLVRASAITRSARELTRDAPPRGESGALFGAKRNPSLSDARARYAAAEEGYRLLRSTLGSDMEMGWAEYKRSVSRMSPEAILREARSAARSNPRSVRVTAPKRETANVKALLAAYHSPRTPSYIWDEARHQLLMLGIDPATTRGRAAKHNPVHPDFHMWYRGTETKSPDGRWEAQFIDRLGYKGGYTVTRKADGLYLHPSGKVKAEAHIFPGNGAAIIKAVWAYADRPAAKRNPRASTLEERWAVPEIKPPRGYVRGPGERARFLKGEIGKIGTVLLTQELRPTGIPGRRDEWGWRAAVWTDRGWIDVGHTLHDTPALAAAEVPKARKRNPDDHYAEHLRRTFDELRVGDKVTIHFRGAKGPTTRTVIVEQVSADAGYGPHIYTSSGKPIPGAYSRRGGNLHASHYGMTFQPTMQQQAGAVTAIERHHAAPVSRGPVYSERGGVVNPRPRVTWKGEVGVVRGCPLFLLVGARGAWGLLVRPPEGVSEYATRGWREGVRMLGRTDTMSLSAAKALASDIASDWPAWNRIRRKP